MSRYRAYIICTSPRSGSTMLCALLKAAGAGAPASYFHEPSVADWAARLGLPTDAEVKTIFRAAEQAGRAGGEIFALRLQRHSFAHLFAQLGCAAPARFEAVFGPTLFIHLTRADKAAQAVSYLRAEQSGLWHAAPDGREIERLSAPQPLAYDEARLIAQHERFIADDADWRAWFAAEGVAPLTIDYDALSADPGGETARVLNALALPTPEPAPPLTAKLADATSADWTKRLKAALARRPIDAGGQRR